MTDSTPARDPLLDQLADAWARHDPPPASLTDRILRAVHAEVAADPFDADYELLLLTSNSNELVGTRAAEGIVTMQFDGDEIQVLLRVSPLSDSECRVDGWVTPGEDLVVTAIQGNRRTDAATTTPGRFEFPALRREPTRLLVSSGAATLDASRFGTQPFDL